jgi:hypothetical protein
MFIPLPSDGGERFRRHGFSSNDRNPAKPPQNRMGHNDGESELGDN